MIKYFHELTKAELDKLIEQKKTYEEVEKDYPQPPWCSYPEAIMVAMGCWSLVGLMVTGEDYCKSCELYLPEWNCNKAKNKNNQSANTGQ